MTELGRDAGAPLAHAAVRYPDMRLVLFSAAEALQAADRMPGHVPERSSSEFAALDFGLKVIEDLLFDDHDGRDGVGEVFVSAAEADACRAIVLHLITAYDEMNRADDPNIDVFDVPTWPFVTGLASKALTVMSQNKPTA